MNDPFRLGTKRVLLLTALAALASLASVARADDNGMNPSTGQSYAVFDGGYTQRAISNRHVDPNLSAWRRAHPSGLSERELQALSSDSSAWQLRAPRRTESLMAEAPRYASAAEAKDLRQTHPSGLSEHELQARSSESWAWRFHEAPGNARLAAEEPKTVAPSAVAPFAVGSQ